MTDLNDLILAEEVRLNAEARDFRTQFPDFPAADLPAIPAGWTDQSWHNDACPFFVASPTRGVFVDFAEPAMRDTAEQARFVVVEMDGDQVGEKTIAMTDDWAIVLQAVA